MKKSFAIVSGLVLILASLGMYVGSISGAIDNSINDGRLSLSSTDPAPSSDITGSTIYWVPNGKGNRIALLDQASSPQAWTMVNVPAPVSLAVPSSANVNYDVFGNLSSGALNLSAVAWSTDSTRATALTTQDGVAVKSGAVAYRYLGTIRTSDILLDSQATIAAGITMYSGNNTVVGQAFAASTESMSGVAFCLWKAGSPTGTAVAKLYACSGTPGSTGVPTGAALATSYQFDVSQLNVYSTWYPFNFITPYSGSAGNYCVTIEYSGGSGSNYIYVNDNTASHSGNEFYNNSGSNVANSSRDLCFKLYGYTTAISEDSVTRRFIYNFYNQRSKQLKKLETANSWTYQLGTYEFFNANSANKVEFVLGDVGTPYVRCYGYNNNANTSIMIGIGLDGFSSSNLAVDAGHVTGASYSSHYAEMFRPISAGYHYAAAIERAFTAGYSTTCFGTAGSGWPEQASGLIGTIDQ